MMNPSPFSNGMEGIYYCGPADISAGQLLGYNTAGKAFSLGPSQNGPYWLSIILNCILSNYFLSNFYLSLALKINQLHKYFKIDPS